MTSSIAALALVLSTLQAPATPSPGASDALVREVRALREAVEQVLAASIRVQLLMGRLQLQEARIQSLARQSAEIDSQIAGLTSERQALTFQHGMMQAGMDETADPREHEQIKQQLGLLAERLKHLDTRHAALLAEQANVQQLVAAEQGRWGDFNARLEELERFLASPTRR